MDYRTFIGSKAKTAVPVGFQPSEINGQLFDFQRDIVKWACERGRAAIFADTGLGKTAMQVEWADQVCKYSGGRVLILAPLCVAQQTVKEAAKFGIKAVYSRLEKGERITVTNYEMLGNFDLSDYAGVVLDESSILKSYMGKTKRELIEVCSSVKYRLACTATPSPNDYLELGNHCEFLGVSPSIILV